MVASLHAKLPRWRKAGFRGGRGAREGGGRAIARPFILFGHNLKFSRIWAFLCVVVCLLVNSAFCFLFRFVAGVWEMSFD